MVLSLGDDAPDAPDVPEEGDAGSEADNETGADNSASDRVFLVVVDDTEEMDKALRFACGRAKSTGGRVALFYAIVPANFEHWMSIGDMIENEQREKAERLVQRLAARVNELIGSLPIIHIREGQRRDVLMALIKEEPSISILVLAAATGGQGPGPLVSAIAGKHIGQLRIPVTIVPGNLSDEQIDALI